MCRRSPFIKAAPVDTIAVGSVMATFAWQPSSDRYKKVARFVDAFFGKFQLFTQAPRHPKWKEVKSSSPQPRSRTTKAMKAGAYDQPKQEALATEQTPQARFRLQELGLQPSGPDRCHCYRN